MHFVGGVCGLLLYSTPVKGGGQEYSSYPTPMLSPQHNASTSPVAEQTTSEYPVQNHQPQEDEQMTASYQQADDEVHLPVEEKDEGIEEPNYDDDDDDDDKIEFVDNFPDPTEENNDELVAGVESENEVEFDNVQDMDMSMEQDRGADDNVTQDDDDDIAHSSMMMLTDQNTDDVDNNDDDDDDGDMFLSQAEYDAKVAQKDAAVVLDTSLQPTSLDFSTS